MTEGTEGNRMMLTVTDSMIHVFDVRRLKLLAVRRDRQTPIIRSSHQTLAS